MRHPIIICCATLALPLAGRAAESGMFLCPSPVIANDYWTDLTTALNLGFKFTWQTMGTIARKDGCSFVAGDDLRPIGSGWAGMLDITDGHIHGWAVPQLYVSYVNRPKN